MSKDTAIFQRYIDLDENIRHPKCHVCAKELKIFAVDKWPWWLVTHPKDGKRSDIIVADILKKNGYDEKVVKKALRMQLLFICDACVPMHENKERKGR